MKQSYIHFEEYKNFFKLFSTDCLSGFNITSSLNYFFIQTKLPKKYFAKSRAERIFTNNTNNSESLLLVNLELFGRGSLGDKYDVFFFKPWIVDEGQEIDSLMEQVLFIIPDFIFYILLESELYKERYQWNNIKNLDVIKTINENDYLKFGINNLKNGTQNFGSYDNSKILEIDKKMQIDKDNYEMKISNEYISVMEDYYKL